MLCQEYGSGERPAKEKFYFFFVRKIKVEPVYFTRIDAANRFLINVVFESKVAVVEEPHGIDQGAGKAKKVLYILLHGFVLVFQLDAEGRFAGYRKRRIVKHIDGKVGEQSAVNEQRTAF